MKSGGPWITTSTVQCSSELKTSQNCYLCGEIYLPVSHPVRQYGCISCAENYRSMRAHCGWLTSCEQSPRRNCLSEILRGHACCPRLWSWPWSWASFGTSLDAEFQGRFCATGPCLNRAGQRFELLPKRICTFCNTRKEEP